MSRGGEALVDRPNEDHAADPERLTQTYLEQVSVNQPFRDLAVFFSSIRHLHLVPQLVREPDRSAGRANDPFGGDFIEQVAKTQERTRTARLRRIQRALRVAVTPAGTTRIRPMARRRASPSSSMWCAASRSRSASTSRSGTIAP